MENNEEMTIKTVKGFDSNLKCRNLQYEVGKTYEIPEGEKIGLCENGFHAVDGDVSPLKVFDYYEPSINGNRSRYCEVEVSGRTASDGNKVVGSKIKIGAEIGIPGLIRAHFEWVKRHITNENNAEAGQPATAGDRGAATAGDRGAATAGSYGAATAGDSGAATAGDSGAATAGDRGAATAGSYGAATAGDRGAATAGDRGAATAGSYGAATSRGSVAVGKNGVATVRGNNIKAKGGLGAIITIAVEQDDNYDIKEWKTLVVDGENIKEDTWYTLKDGEFVEVTEQVNE